MVKNDPKLKIEKSFRHPTCIRVSDRAPDVVC